MNYNGHWYFDDDAKAEQFQKLLFSNGYRWNINGRKVCHLPSNEGSPAIVYCVENDYRKITYSATENFDYAKDTYKNVKIFNFNNMLMETE